jgi:hypothetical protein
MKFASPKIAASLRCAMVLFCLVVSSAYGADYGPDRALVNHLAEWAFTSSSHSYGPIQ